MSSPKLNECTICKHYGLKTAEPNKLEMEKLYDEDDNVVPVSLCRAHGVDLFKLGQKKFLINHYKILNGLIDSDEPKFIELLEKAYRSNLDKIF